MSVHWEEKIRGGGGFKEAYTLDIFFINVKSFHLDRIAIAMTTT